MGCNVELGEYDRRLLALWDKWAVSGAVEAPHERETVVEFLHATEWDIAWDYTMSNLRGPQYASAEDRAEALAFLVHYYGRIEDRAHLEAHVDRVLAWTETREGPFPMNS